MKQRTSILSILLVAGLGGLFVPLVRAAEKPNFVIIFTDDQGYAELSCFGGTHVSTPRIDRMAAEGNKHGSIAVVERFHRTLKDLLRLITVPEDESLFTRKVGLIVHWYNEDRPHDTLDGKTPNEVYFPRPAANQQPRLEPRKHWPRSSPCAKPQVGIEGEPGDPIIFEIDCLENRRHLPIIRAHRAA